MKWLCLICLVLIIGCTSDDPCEDSARSPLRIGFYYQGVDEQPAQQAIIDSLSVFPLDRPDTLIYNNAYGVSRIELPPDPGSDQCLFVLVFPRATDTLMLQYERILSLVSAECGFRMDFQLQEVTISRHAADNIHISEPMISPQADEHIQIFVPRPAAF